MPRKYPRVGMNLMQAWIRSCKKGIQPTSHYGYATRLTETVLLGTVAIGAQKPIEWDSENMKVTNVPEANRFVRREYRDGWSL